MTLWRCLVTLTVSVISRWIDDRMVFICLGWALVSACGEPGPLHYSRPAAVSASRSQTQGANARASRPPPDLVLFAQILVFLLQLQLQLFELGLVGLVLLRLEHALVLFALSHRQRGLRLQLPQTAAARLVALRLQRLDELPGRDGPQRPTAPARTHQLSGAQPAPRGRLSTATAYVVQLRELKGLVRLKLLPFKRQLFGGELARLRCGKLGLAVGLVGHQVLLKAVLERLVLVLGGRLLLGLLGLQRDPPQASTPPRPVWRHVHRPSGARPAARSRRCR